MFAASPAGGQDVRVHDSMRASFCYNKTAMSAQHFLSWLSSLGRTGRQDPSIAPLVVVVEGSRKRREEGELMTESCGRGSANR